MCTLPIAAIFQNTTTFKHVHKYMYYDLTSVSFGRVLYVLHKVTCICTCTVACGYWLLNVEVKGHWTLYICDDVTLDIVYM